MIFPFQVSLLMPEDLTTLPPSYSAACTPYSTPSHSSKGDAEKVRNDRIIYFIILQIKKTLNHSKALFYEFYENVKRNQNIQKVENHF